METDLWNIDLNLDFGDSDIKHLEPEPEKIEKRRATECLELSLKYEFRRGFSESKLLDAMGGFNELKENHSYNFITGGDVDGLTYLQLVLRYKKQLDYLLLSTWVMAAEDIFKLTQWIKNGTIKKCDFYLGEIFPHQYRVEWSMLKKLIEETHCGRVAFFKNHSKIFAGYSNDFYFGIQMSCNINTNPRTENGCITINRQIFDFYKNYFDNIKSFKE